MWLTMKVKQHEASGYLLPPNATSATMSNETRLHGVLRAFPSVEGTCIPLGLEPHTTQGSNDQVARCHHISIRG